MDDLIARLMARAADPERRTEVRRSAFIQRVTRLDPGALLGQLGQVRADLDRALEAARGGRVDPPSHLAAEGIAAEMRRPAHSELPTPVPGGTVEEAETALGVPLPALLRRIYTEISDGGFGPGEGLLSLGEMVETYRSLRTGDELPRGRSWPQGLVPLCRRDPGFDCIDPGGRIVGWDPEGLSERSGEAAFRRSFRELAPSLEGWLAAWVDEPTFEERMAKHLAAANIKAAREARARIAAKTPEERAQMGLPEVGWEKVVWGGLGLEDEDGR